MELKQLALGALGTNCYVAYNEQKDALIFDPGGDANKLTTFIDQFNLNPIAILLTHAHFDHIGAVDQIRENYQIPVYVHEQEKEWLSNSRLNGSSLFPVDEVTAKDPDKLLMIGDMKLTGFDMEIRHTPGHSPGGVIFIFHDQELIIGGDSLFRFGIGRTDLPGGDHNQLLHSIKSELYSLSDTYRVYPGHGDPTTIGEEKRQNPFVTAD